MKNSRVASSKPAFGIGWIVAFLLAVTAASLLWTGIASGTLEQLRAAIGEGARWIWLGVVFVAAVVLPLLVPRPAGAGRFRSFQLWSLLLMLLALGGAVALRPSSLVETSRTGVRTMLLLVGDSPLAPAVSPPIAAAVTPVGPAPQRDVEEQLANYLTGERYQTEKVAAVPEGYADSLTRASAAEAAKGLLERHGTYLGLALLANANVPHELQRLKVLEAHLNDTRKQVVGKRERDALALVLQLQAELTRELLISAADDVQALATKVRAEAIRDAGSAECTSRGTLLHCTVKTVLLVLEREDGAWRVQRQGSFGLLPVAADLFPSRAGPTGADEHGDEEARALFTLDRVMRSRVRIDLRRSLDPDIVESFTDDAAMTFADLGGFLMDLQLGKLADKGKFPQKDALEFRMWKIDLLKRSHCDPVDAWRALIDRWNELLGEPADVPADEPEDLAVEALVNSVVLKRKSDTVFELFDRKSDGSLRRQDARLELRDGQWVYWTSRLDKLKCEH